MIPLIPVSDIRCFSTLVKLCSSDRSSIARFPLSMRASYSSFIVFCIAILFVFRGTLIDRLRRTLSTYRVTISSQMDTTTHFEGIPSVPPQDPSLTASPNMTVPRAIKQAFLAVEQAEGAGARVRRSIGTPKLRNFSPFLMLDHFTISPGAGFPDHPHRGQETITYLLSGAVDHEDFASNKGTIWPGDLQFMTAGRGIMHAEMPHHEPPDPKTGVAPSIVGMQLWVDLPQKLKKCEPRYRDLRSSEIPKVTLDDGKVEVKVISGQSHGVDSVQELAYTPVWLLDVLIKPGGRITQNLPKTWNAFAYTLQGTTKFGVGKDAQAVEQYHNVVFQQQGDVIVAEVAGGAKEESRFILVAGIPLDQKVVQYGPFVLNSQDEVYQAVMDFQTNSNGFERGLNWESEIGKMMAH